MQPFEETAASFTFNLSISASLSSVSPYIRRQNTYSTPETTDNYCTIFFSSGVNIRGQSQDDLQPDTKALGMAHRKPKGVPRGQQLRCTPRSARTLANVSISGLRMFSLSSVKPRKSGLCVLTSRLKVFTVKDLHLPEYMEANFLLSCETAFSGYQHVYPGTCLPFGLCLPVLRHPSCLRRIGPLPSSRIDLPSLSPTVACSHTLSISQQIPLSKQAEVAKVVAVVLTTTTTTTPRKRILIQTPTITTKAKTKRRRDFFPHLQQRH